MSGVEEMASTVSAAVRGWQEATLRRFWRANKRASEASLGGLEARLRDELLLRVADPTLTRHEQLVAMLRGLPAEVAALCTSATARHEFESLRDVTQQSHHLGLLASSAQQQSVKLERGVSDGLGSLSVLRRGTEDVVSHVDMLAHAFTSHTISAGARSSACV
jgi:hypothetical protein